MRIAILPNPNYSLLINTLILATTITSMVGCINTEQQSLTQVLPESFDGDRAFQHVVHQVELGARTPGTDSHNQLVEWIRSLLLDEGWEVEIQEAMIMGKPIRNIIAKQANDAGESLPFIIIGAHYDTRIFADQDPDPANRTKPVPGANDGASGVAVLLELANVLPQVTRNHVQLVFFDAEDNGNIPGWDWILGSTAFVAELEDHPEVAVIIDMIGDSDLNIFEELNSDPELTDEIWNVASELGYSEDFISMTKYRITDDHLPFLRAGIRAVDIIDFDYPYWHTIEDTPDKVSATSLQIVGETINEWLVSKYP